MAFCTLLEWDDASDMGNYEAMVERSGGHEQLPEGCLGRIVGAVDGGARFIEVWRGPDDARAFSERYSHLLAGFKMPAPTRASAFETTIYEVLA
jgi:hypothetical protein